MNTWTRDGLSMNASEGSQTEALTRFFATLAKSRWANAFVLGGDALLEALLANKARHTRTLRLLSRISPSDAKTAIEMIAENAGLQLESDVNGMQIELLFDCRLPLRPQRREVFGAKVLCMPLEMLIVEEALSLSEGITRENVAYLYDIAMLAQTCDVDGRVLYEALMLNAPGDTSALSDIPGVGQPEWLVKCLYEFSIASNGFDAPNFQAALQLCRSLLLPVYRSLIQEREFFGYWNAQFVSWTQYPKIAEA